MNNKVLITGAMSGIGLACARLFLDKGWIVYIADKLEDKEVLDELIQMYPEKVFYTKTDVSKDKDIKYLHSKIKEKIQGVNSIINNAGIITHGLLHETS